MPLDQAVRWFPRKLKAGHTGTLDPLASGVLVLALGSATRLVDLVQRMPKLYRTRILLGARSDTLDADGRVENVSIPVIPDVESIRQVLAGQVGEILQRPPAFSAVKVNGRALTTWPERVRRWRFLPGPYASTVLRC